MAELMDHVEALADQIGPRPVSTEEERQASMYIAQELTDLGLEVNVDEFATPTGVRWPYTIAFAAVIVGTILSGLGMFIEQASTPFFVVGLLLTVIGFAIFYTERQNMALLSSRRAGGVSQNVVAKYVPSSVARERSRRKIVIAAHVDTVRAEPQAMPSVINRYPLIRKILFYVMIALPVILLIRLFPLPWPEVIDLVLWVISLVGCVLVLAALVCIVANRFMPYVSGGNDNASSAAVMLSVASRLLDPEERERYSREQYEYEPEIPVETFAPQTTGSFAPVGEEDDDEYVMHDSEEAYEAGVVPEGAEIEYEEQEGGAEIINLFGDAPAQDADKTVAMPQVWGDDDDQHEFVDEQGAYEDYNETDEQVADVVQAFPTLSAADQPVVDWEDEAAPPLTAEEEAFVSELEVPGAVEVPEPVAHEQAEPEEEPAAEQDEQEEPEAEPEPAEEPAEEDFDEPEPEPEPEAEADEVEEEPEEAAPQSRTNAFLELIGEEPEEEPKPAVPAWYTAAREKAAKDRAAKEEAVAAEKAQAQQLAEKEEQEAKPAYRSRFADMPLTRTRVEEEPEEEPVVEEPQRPAPRRRLVDLHTGEDIEPLEAVAEEPEEPVEPEDEAAAEQAPEAEPEAEAGAEAEQAEQPAEQEEKPAERTPLFKLDISDEDLDDISPDLTSGIPAMNESQASKFKALTARIPSIESDKPAVEAKAEEPKRQPDKPRVERRKPTARRATEEFKPTRVADDRERIELGSTRQVAAVSSSYEDTPQAAPKQRQATQENEPIRARSTQAGLSGTMRPTRPAADSYSRPGNTSSFPALTGSFPSLTGSFQRVNADDFGTPTGGDFLAPRTTEDSFASSPAMTGQIDIPESRFHNAVDNAAGFLGKLGRKGKNTRRDEFEPSDEWGESDDFGWKGGGYFSDEEGLGDAARRRAAEIRESVISMTESDLLDKEVWFVALGASNAGGQGMKNFLDLHRSELRGALIVNLEAVGSGEICYVDYEGTGKLNRADRRLMSLVKRASRELRGKEMPAASLDYRNTDATPAMMSGMRAMTIMGFDGVAPEGWHWSTDTSDIVNPDKLDYVSRLLMKMIENS